MVDSESKRRWKFGVRSKYIVRPSAVQEVAWAYGQKLSGTMQRRIIEIHPDWRAQYKEGFASQQG